MSLTQLRRLAPADTDLATIVAELNSEERWGDYDQKFTVDSLKKFLGRDDQIYLLAYIGEQIAGASHAYLMQHPAGPKYLYIDEVDTSSRFRRQGVATAMMREMIRLSKELGSDEAWLGTEDDNEAAKALYEKLKPSEVEHGPLYMYKTKDNKPEWQS